MCTNVNTYASANASSVIDALRKEAELQKECITRYVFQVMVFSAAIWSFLFNFHFNSRSPNLYMGGTLLVFILMNVMRMANHKYHTVNRNLGYELHLSRIRDYAMIGNPLWADKLMEIGWEEAMCAWRVVQATIFVNLYHKAENFLMPHRLRREHRKKGLYRWYNTQRLLKVRQKSHKASLDDMLNATYHAGKYLRNIQLFLITMSIFSLTVMIYCYNQSSIPPASGQLEQRLPFVDERLITTLLIVITCYTATQFIRHTSFRRILEHQLLSIQSCAVVWRVVATCHLIAVTRALNRRKSYQYYTVYCEILALDFTKSFYEPHEWMKRWETLWGTSALGDELDRLFQDVDRAL